MLEIYNEKRKQFTKIKIFRKYFNDLITLGKFESGFFHFTIQMADLLFSQGETLKNKSNGNKQKETK